MPNVPSEKVTLPPMTREQIKLHIGALEYKAAHVVGRLARELEDEVSKLRAALEGADQNSEGEGQ